jgi:hypothetical protein
VTRNPWRPPGGIVNGNESPLRTNSGLLLVAEEIVTCELPAKRVPLTRARSYLHRTKIHGWRINCELVVIGACPHQTQHRDLALDSEMSETCETNEMLPFLAPMDCGAKMALKVKLSPLPRGKVKSSPITANPVPRW